MCTLCFYDKNVFFIIHAHIRYIRVWSVWRQNVHLHKPRGKVQRSHPKPTLFYCDSLHSCWSSTAMSILASRRSYIHMVVKLYYIAWPRTNIMEIGFCVLAEWIEITLVSYHPVSSSLCSSHAHTASVTMCVFRLVK